MVTKSWEQRMQCVEDISRIKNLMAKYSYYHTAGMFEDIIEMFAAKTPGVRFTMSDLGIWEGREGLKRFFLGFLKHSRGDGVGQMSIQALTTPYIEVAGDGKTARGLLISPGVMVDKSEESKLQAGWNWVKAAQDFVKEDGQWKFWHFHVYRIFYSPYERSWVEAPPRPAPVIPDEFKPDKTGIKDYPYSTDTIPVYIPALPEPYETFDESTAY